MQYHNYYIMFRALMVWLNKLKDKENSQDESMRTS